MKNKVLTKDDIEVFVLTYNRANLLNKAVDSILQQSVGPLKVTIIDNASTDNTQALIENKQKNYPNLFYFRQPVHLSCFAENLRAAQEKAQSKYVMFFHDDDIAHPQYIEIALKLINKYQNTDLVCTLLKTFTDEKEIEICKFDKVRYTLFPNKNAFTAHIYGAMFTNETSLYFPNLIYKTENIKHIYMNSDIGGKTADKPFVISSLKEGTVLQIREPEIFNYRIHEAQDSQNKKEVNPTCEQIIEHQKFFKEKLSFSNQAKKVFFAFALDWAEMLYIFGHNDLSKKSKRNFYKLCYKNGILDLNTLLSKTGFFRSIHRKIYKKRKELIKKILKKSEPETLILDME